MYKRGVITDEVSQDLDVVIGLMRRYGIQGAEIRTIWNTRVDQLAPHQVRILRDRLSAEGLVVPALATPFFKCDLGDAQAYREHLDVLRRSIGVAHELGTAMLRTFTFWRTEPRPSWEPIVDAYQEPADLARRAGVTLGIENEGSCSVGTGAELDEFLTALASPHVRGIWDPGNAVAEPGYPDGYERAKRWCPHVHLKDLRVEPDGSTTAALLGDGNLDVRGQLAALRRDGYTGFVSLETHWRPQQLSEEQLRRPGGEQFSAFGVEATSACFERWDRIERDLA